MCLSQVVRLIMKILLIEDDKLLGETLAEYLQIEGIETLWLWDERQIVKIIKQYEFDVIVVDLILKFSSGEELILALRKAGIQTPILVITAKRSITDKERCFIRGADDYLIKPFEFKEIVLRIKALCNRRHRENIVTIRDIVVNLDAKTLHSGKEEIKISQKAWDVLCLLIKNRGEVVDTETILDYVWQDKDVGEEIVRAYIKQLRKILPPDSIQVYYGQGYKLN